MFKIGDKVEYNGWGYISHTGIITDIVSDEYMENFKIEGSMLFPDGRAKYEKHTWFVETNIKDGEGLIKVIE